MSRRIGRSVCSSLSFYQSSQSHSSNYTKYKDNEECEHDSYIGHLLRSHPLHLASVSFLSFIYFIAAIKVIANPAINPVMNIATRYKMGLINFMNSIKS